MDFQLFLSLLQECPCGTVVFKLSDRLLISSTNHKGYRVPELVRYLKALYVCVIFLYGNIIKLNLICLYFFPDTLR